MGSLVERNADVISGNAGNDSQEQYLTFKLGKQMFGIGIMQIKEIIEYGEVTEIPMMPEFIRGVINLRDHAVPVLSLQERFNQPCSEIHKRTCIVILEISNGDHVQNIGVIVDTVSEVLNIPASHIEASPRFNTDIDTEFIKGIGKVDDKFIILLDINKVLSSHEISMLADSTPASLEE